MTISGSGAGVADLNAEYWAGETDSRAAAIETLANSYAPDTNPWAEYEADRARALADKVGGNPDAPSIPSLAAAEATLRMTITDEDRILEEAFAEADEQLWNDHGVDAATHCLAISQAAKDAAEAHSDSAAAQAARGVYRTGLPGVQRPLTIARQIDGVIGEDFLVSEPQFEFEDVTDLLAEDTFGDPAEMADTYTQGVAEEAVLRETPDAGEWPSDESSTAETAEEGDGQGSLIDPRHLARPEHMDEEYEYRSIVRDTATGVTSATKIVNTSERFEYCEGRSRDGYTEETKIVWDASGISITRKVSTPHGSQTARLDYRYETDADGNPGVSINSSVTSTGTFADNPSGMVNVDAASEMLPGYLGDPNGQWRYVDGIRVRVVPDGEAFLDPSWVDDLQADSDASQLTPEEDVADLDPQNGYDVPAEESGFWGKCGRFFSDALNFRSKASKLVADAMRDWTDAKWNYLEGKAEQTGFASLAAVVAFCGSLDRAATEMVAGMVDMEGSLEATVEDVKTSIEYGKRHGAMVGVSRQVGTLQIAEAIYGVDIQTGEEVNWMDKVAEGSGRIGATSGMAAGGWTGLVRGKGLLRPTKPRTPAQGRFAPKRMEFPGFRVGDPITKALPDGSYPRWFAKEAAEKANTIQGRYWMNRASAAAPGEFTPRQLAKMRNGFAPQVKIVVRNRATRQIEIQTVSKELHHNLGNRGTWPFDGPLHLRELWPWQHEMGSDRQ